jgi:hypothetical protein
MQFMIGLAGVLIEIHSIHDAVYRLCEDYLVEAGQADFTVEISQSDIEYERQKSIREAILEHLRPIAYSDSYLETLAVYRKIAAHMLAYDTFLMHGSVVAVRGGAYLFAARSGTGKTTHTRLWLENIPGSFVVNGDKPLIRVRDGYSEACGTPWAGKEAMNTNVIIPLKAICLLERGQKNYIEELPFKKAYVSLFQHIYRPGEEGAVRKTMELIQKLRESVHIYRLVCNMEPEAAIMAADAMIV